MEHVQRGNIVRINDFGLFEVELPDRMRAVFTIDKLSGYGGEPYSEIGLTKGAIVEVKVNEDGRVSVAELVSH